MLFNQYYNLYAEVKVHLVKFDCQFIKNNLLNELCKIPLHTDQ